MKNVTGVDKSDSAKKKKKADLATLKPDVDEQFIDKLETVLTD